MTHFILSSQFDTHILQLTLNRPEKRNALHVPLLKELAQTLDNIPDQVRGIILKGEGPAFCTGMDLKECSDEAVAAESANLLAYVYEKLYTLPAVTLAAVHGSTFAGGAGLMLACDGAIGSLNARIAFPETQRGLVASQVMTLMSKRLRPADLKRLLLFGDTIDAPEAHHLGILLKAVPVENLNQASLEMMMQALRGAPLAVRLTKELLACKDIHQQLADATALQLKLRLSPEAREGAAAFLEKRNAKWNSVR